MLKNDISISDANGTITLNLGALDYNETAGDVDSFFRIYVNGKKTQYTITSTGSNETRFISVELNDH